MTKTKIKDIFTIIGLGSLGLCLILAIVTMRLNKNCNVNELQKGYKFAFFLGVVLLAISQLFSEIKKENYQNSCVGQKCLDPKSCQSGISCGFISREDPNYYCCNNGVIKIWSDNWCSQGIGCPCKHNDQCPNGICEESVCK